MIFYCKDMISEENEKCGPSESEDCSVNGFQSSFDNIVTPSKKVDKVRQLVQEEGRSARNLIAYSVPVNECEFIPISERLSVDVGLADESQSASKNMKRPPISPRTRVFGFRRHLLCTIEAAHKARSVKRTAQQSSKDCRVRSASAGRDPKLNLSSRYWAFLFENLQRAVDEIYQTCDTDQSVIECKETIMMLENYIKEFHCLIEWLELNKNFEEANPNERPTSLTWEVKKSSPGRPICASPTMDKRMSAASGSAARKLIFTSTTDSSTQSGKDTTSSNVWTNNRLTKQSVMKSVATNQQSGQATMTNGLVRNASKKCVGNSQQSSVHEKINSDHTNDHNRRRHPQSHSTTIPARQSSVSKKVITRSGSASKITTKKKINAVEHVDASALSTKYNKLDQKTGSSSSLSSTSSNSQSWADKVKGTSASTTPVAATLITPINEMTEVVEQKNELKSNSNKKAADDNDGWETVHRGKYKSRSTPPTDRNLANNATSKKSLGGRHPLGNKNQEHLLPNYRITKYRGTGNLHNDKLTMAKSMPSLNLKKKVKVENEVLADDAIIDNDSHETKDVETGALNANSKTVSLPDVSQVVNQCDVDTFNEDNNGNLNNCSENERGDHSQGFVNESFDAAGSHKDDDNLETGSFDLSQEDQAELMRLDASLELVTQQEQHLMIENNQQNQDMMSLINANECTDNVIEVHDDVECKQQETQRVEEYEEKVTLDWAEIVERHQAEMAARTESIEQTELRQPGRALQMHEKLSSPSRKRSSLSETIRRHEEKQAKAQEQRERLLEEKAQKLRDQSKKIEEIRAWKDELLVKRKTMMEKKLERAEQKRRNRLQLVVKKAHDEEEKVNEIAFINSLEAQNKRHEVLSRHKDHQARLQDIQEERQRKQEEKAAKEAAAEERRKMLENERLARLQEIQEKRKQRDMKIEQNLQEKEKERLEFVREKAREREQKLSALTAAQTATAEELQKKIKLKQEESARRHEENIEQKRQKAWELSIKRYSSNDDDAPRLVPYDTLKLCTLCNVLIKSEVYLLSHLHGKTHRQEVKDKNGGKDLNSDELENFNLKSIVDAPSDRVDPNIVKDKERQKSLKKRCKKLRHRMLSRATEYENVTANKRQQVESQNKAKLLRCIKEINKCVQNQGSGPWPTNQVSALERSVGEINRMLNKGLVSDQIAFRVLGGISMLAKLLNIINAENKDSPSVIPAKSLVNICNAFKLSCVSCRLNCSYVLYSSLIINVIDVAAHKLNLMLSDEDQQNRSSPTLNVSVSHTVNPLAGSLLETLASVLSCLAQQPEINDDKGDGENQGFLLRAQDTVSYIVCVGIVDKISEYFRKIQGPVDNEPAVADFLHQCVLLLISVVNLLSNKYNSVFGKRKCEDVTQLIPTLLMTELFGTISLLYGILLHSGAASPESGNPPPKLPTMTVTLAIAVLQLLNHVALLDLQLLQSVVGSEGISLEFRHIASYLLWYCTYWPDEQLLHQVIILTGYFTVLNNDNQIVLQSGHCPTVLQQLCALPFSYFSDPVLRTILFPTLIACCHNNKDNKDILEQDMSSSLLAIFIEERSFAILQADLLPSKTSNLSDSWSLQNRFPEERWNEALEFFNS